MNPSIETSRIGRGRKILIVEKCMTTRITTMLIVALILIHSSNISYAKKPSTTPHLTMTTAAAVVGTLNFPEEETFGNQAKNPVVQYKNSSSISETFVGLDACSSDRSDDKTWDVLSSNQYETTLKFVWQGKDKDRGVLWSYIHIVLCFMTYQILHPILSLVILLRVQMRYMFKGVVNIYLLYLETYPIITKSVTAAFIQGVGDFSSQTFERKRHSSVESKVSPKRKQKYDYQRTLAISAEGIFISGPMMHLAYDFFESILPISESEGLMGWVITFIHVAADTFIMDTFFVLSALVISGILEGMSIQKQLLPQIRNEFMATTQAAWKSSFMLCPLQFICFRFLPVSLRVMAMNLQDIVWNAVVSYMIHRRR